MSRINEIMVNFFKKIINMFKKDDKLENNNDIKDSVILERILLNINGLM